MKMTNEMKAKEARRVSREIFGTPGANRKTWFNDRKKDANRKACRGKAED